MNFRFDIKKIMKIGSWTLFAETGIHRNKSHVIAVVTTFLLFWR